MKIPDIKQKRYGISFFDPVLNQILLLKYIDEYYNRYFEQGNIQQKVFYTEKSINKRDKADFVERLREEAKGIKNAHQSFLLETKLESINLTDEINTEAFLNYRTELQKSIAIRLNMPYDLLDTTSSNKASSLTAIQAFNEYTVMPIQKILLDAIKTIVGDDPRRSKEDIEELRFNNLNTKDRNIESDTIKNLYEQGVITLNEAREWMNFKPLPDGDKIKTPSKASFELGKDDIELIENMKDLIDKEYHNAKK
ncbi:MAG: phage portal protein [Candidatus Peribacteria bacterium]|nr:phage portal protein [Candidatus Peribacteria bacterium]